MEAEHEVSEVNEIILKRFGLLYLRSIVAHFRVCTLELERSALRWDFQLEKEQRKSLRAQCWPSLQDGQGVYPDRAIPGRLAPNLSGKL